MNVIMMTVSKAGRYKDFQSCTNAEVDDSLIRGKT